MNDLCDVLGEALDFDSEPNSKLTVFIPVAPKDYDMLPYTISSIRKYVQDPIAEIVVAGSVTDQLNEMCNSLQAKCLDENIIFNHQEFFSLYKELPGMEYNGSPGWYYQQLLKLMFAEYSKSSNYLVVDSDVIFTRPFQAIINDTYQFYTRARGYGIDWGECYIKKMLDIDSAMPYSFIFDMMILNKQNVLNLISAIEIKANDKLEKVILKFDKVRECRFSEFETYGVYTVNSKSLKINTTMLNYTHGCRKNIEDDLRNDALMSQNGLVAYHRWIC